MKEPSRSRSHSTCSTLGSPTTKTRSISVAELERAIEAGDSATRILALLDDGQWWAARDIAANVGLTPGSGAIGRALNSLAESGRIQKRTATVNGRVHSCYRLSQ